MKNTINEEKSALRKVIRALPPPMEREVEGRSAADFLLEWPVFQMAEIIGCYVSMPHEIDTWPVLHAVLNAGKTLALPKTYDKGVMEFRRVVDPAFLHPGRWNILEPAGDAQVISPKALSLLLIPALAVDHCGHRLGQGGGYYDRYLPYTNCPLAALILSRQVVSCVPCGERDYLVQWIITGNGVLPIERWVKG